MRRILGVLIGIAAGYVTVFILETLGHLLFPVDPAIDAGAPEFLDAVPLGAKVAVVLAWFFGALVGAYVGRRIGGWLGAGWIVVAVIILAGLSTIFMLPHPLWMQVSAVVVPILGGLVADRLPGGRRVA